MQVDIREFAPRKAVCVSHQGPYYMIGQTFGKLAQWLKDNPVEAGQRLGIFYDDPDTTPINELRSDAGAFVPDDFTTDDPSVHIVAVVSGTYAVGTYVGPYDGLPNAWGELVGKWLPASGHTLRNVPSFEVYINDCFQAPAELRTELYVPVTAASGLTE